MTFDETWSREEKDRWFADQYAGYVNKKARGGQPKYLGSFVHEIAGQAKTRDWLVKGMFLARTFSLCLGEPGCISGDAAITFQTVNGNGNGSTYKTISLEAFYHKFHRKHFMSHCIKWGTRGFWPEDTSVFVRSVDEDGNIFMNRVINAIESGEKECFRVTLKDGRTVDATADHKFLCENGYVMLADLLVGDCVMAHSHKIKNRNKGTGRPGQRKMFYVKDHPTARTKVIEGRYRYKVIPRARAVVEAHMNGMVLDDYIEMLNAGGDLSNVKTLSRWQNVHHLNEDFLDDRLENLEVISHGEHAGRHATGSLKSYVEPVDIVSIANVGVKKTFDLQVNGPYNNFIVNDFAVHNCGKSFLMLDYAMTAALCSVTDSPRMWFGRRIKPCGVVYVSAEGQEDFAWRIHAWTEQNRVTGVQLPFYLIPTVVDLCNGTDGVNALVKEIKAKSVECERLFGVPFGVVVIDTVSRAMAGGDENSPAHMGAFVKNCGYLREQADLAVIGVHHTPMAAARARGHSLLHGSTDAEIMVTRAQDGGPNTWRLTRSKCGPVGASHNFSVHQVRLGYDEDGDDITSCIVAPEIEQATARPARSNGLGRLEDEFGGY